MTPNKEIPKVSSSRWASAMSVCLIGILAFFFTSCGKEEEKPVAEVVRPVKTMTVAANVTGSGFTLPGKVRASKRVNLAFKEVSGRLIELPIEGKEGEPVKEGDLLARIDPKDFKTAVRNAEGQLKEAIAAVDLAKDEYDRIARIRKEDPGAASEALLVRKREAWNQAKGRVTSLEAALDDAKNKLNYTSLFAPFSGVIAKRYVDNFKEVKPTEPIVSLQDVSQVEVLVGLPENVMAFANKLGPSLDVHVEFPTAPGKHYELALKEAATDADPATQTYQVTLQMPQPEGLTILPGMTGSVVIAQKKGEETEAGEADDQRFIIPAIAVMGDPNGKSYLWVVDNMTVHKKEVKVGPLTGSQDIKVLEGLEGGETIVVAGVTKLQEGMQVTIWEQ
jgi:RND family efflux transporter MFP subunit